MGQWKLHWLDATGDLSPWRDRITFEIDAAVKAMAPFVPPQRLDVLLERGDESVRPDLGMAAHVTRPNLVTLVFDPYNDNFADSLTSRVIRRQMVNAAHRALRAEGPGYGFTLGGALVSEGLASAFVRLVFDTPRERWERMDDAVMARHWPDQRVIMSPRFDRSEWFHGNGDLPFGLGYAMGAKVVEDWLTSGVALDAGRLISVPAPKVLQALRVPVAG